LEVIIKNDNSRKVRTAALLLSVLLHLLLLILIAFHAPLKQIELAESTPLSQSEPQEKRLTFELVETPETVPQELPSAKTDLASDRSARARDDNTDSEKPEGLPWAEGIVEARNYPRLPEPAAEALQEKQEQTQNGPDQNDESFMADLIRKQEAALQNKPLEPEPSFKNLDTSAPDLGGFSFNTYNWDFAPYLLSMKRRIRSNMHLPYAFTHLGAISGKIMVHFTVQPSGEVSALQILNSDAHYSLEQSSVNAIRNSSAFLPLPDDFPEDRLEVTAQFSFSIIKD
jgi:TonB family protein